MLTQETHLRLQMARTLWYNTYRGRVTDMEGNYVATLRLIPAIPLDRSEIPPDAPEATQFVIVLVEDGVIDADGLVDFERSVSDLVMTQMTQGDFKPEFCEFSYPSPIQMMDEEPVCPS